MATMLEWMRVRYAVTPVATVAVAYAVLASVRVGGAYSLPLMVASVALTPLVLLVVPRASWSEIGLCRSRSRRLMLASVVTVVGAYAATVTASYAAFGAGENNWLSKIPTLFAALVPQPKAAQVVVALVCLGALVPLVEEVFYRGLLFDAIARRGGPFVAVLATGVLWALVHLGDYGLHPYEPRVIAGCLTSVLVMGLGLGVCRLLTGSVAACVVAQGVANVALFTFLLLHPWSQG